MPSNPTSPSSKRKALFRVVNSDPECASGTQATVMEVLRLVPEDMKVARLDRRPASGGTPFRDVYFIELEQLNVSDRTAREWEVAVKSLHVKLRESVGQSTSLIGKW